MTQATFCFNFRCNYVSEEGAEMCPKCGGKMRTTGQIKMTGWFQLIIGIFLAGLMGVVIYKLAPFMLERLNSEGPIERFTGTAQQALFFLALLAAVFLFGFINVIIGIWHIKTGRQNKLLTYLILILAVILFGIAWGIKRKYGA